MHNNITNCKWTSRINIPKTNKHHFVAFVLVTDWSSECSKKMNNKYRYWSYNKWNTLFSQTDEVFIQWNYKEFTEILTHDFLSKRLLPAQNKCPTVACKLRELIAEPLAVNKAYEYLVLHRRQKFQIIQAGVIQINLQENVYSIKP